MVLDCVQGDVSSVVQVIDVELGSMVPGISNLRALPCPTGVLWPQSVFDLDYGGMVQVLHSLANSQSFSPCPSCTHHCCGIL